MERPPHTCLIHHIGKPGTRRARAAGSGVRGTCTLMCDVSPGKDQKRHFEQGVRQENRWIVTLCL